MFSVHRSFTNLATPQKKANTTEKRMQIFPLYFCITFVFFCLGLDTHTLHFDSFSYLISKTFSTTPEKYKILYLVPH